MGARGVLRQLHQVLPVHPIRCFAHLQLDGSQYVWENVSSCYIAHFTGTNFNGQPYENVITGLSNVGYDINNYSLDIRGEWPRLTVLVTMT